VSTIPTLVAAAVCAVFLVLALWHVRMAALPMAGASGAVPTVDGKPLFTPSKRSTLLVAAVLGLFAVLVAATADFIPSGVSPRVLSWLSYGLALGLLARAIGEFRYVGFFKRVRGTKFAKLDTMVYSPLCLLLALGMALTASRNGG
jgi:hypothetical protein